ncbi:RHS repeat-associated core domain-containing protein [Trinickia diaoshuihuensis]|uniref:RHS repeat-associated core domain-containing protein n=1 Tax=Trinickia diaoshuihuensis TaxID=2292265 RepID=UPI0019673AD2|nr:RHS repeat-associated core domain-containing protein [Trinickia diaoshuihuensis]
MNSILAQGFADAYQDPVTTAYPLGNGYRFYLPALMRFSAQDAYSPFGKGGVHAYGYCATDPINLKDPSGHDFLGSFLSLLDPVHDINQYILKPLGVKMPQWAKTVERVTRDVAFTAVAIAALPETGGASAAVLAANVLDITAMGLSIGADISSTFQTGSAQLVTEALSYASAATGVAGVDVRAVRSFVNRAYTGASLAREAERGLVTSTEEGAEDALRSTTKITSRFSSLPKRVMHFAGIAGVANTLTAASLAERFTNEPPARVVAPEVQTRSPELPGGDPGGSSNPDSQKPNRKQRRILTGSGQS